MNHYQRQKECRESRRPGYQAATDVLQRSDLLTYEAFAVAFFVSYHSVKRMDLPIVKRFGKTFINMVELRKRYHLPKSDITESVINTKVDNIINDQLV